MTSSYVLEQTGPSGFAEFSRKASIGAAAAPPLTLRAAQSRDSGTCAVRPPLSEYNRASTSGQTAHGLIHEKAAPSPSIHVAVAEAVAAPRLSTARKLLLSLVITLNTFIAAASGNAVTVTLPAMARHLDINQVDAQWSSSAFSLSYGCVLLFSGRLADIHGRRKMFLARLALSAAFALPCAFMKWLVPLCVLRALSGAGLALATPAGFVIIGVMFREEPERTIAFACFGLGNPVGAAVGTLIGGAVAGSGGHGWAHIYVVLAVVTVTPSIIGFFVVPTDDRRDLVADRRVDWLGGLLVTGGLVLFTFSITESSVAADGWKAPCEFWPCLDPLITVVPALLVVSVLLLVAFGFWEYNVERRLSFPPLAKLSLFTRQGAKVSAVLANAFCLFVSIAGWVYLASLLLQNHKRMSPLDAAVHMLPATGCGLFAAGCVMWVMPRFRAPYIIMVGGVLSGLANLLFAVEPDGTTYWACEFVGLICLPFGADLTVGVGSIVMSNLCDDDEQSVAASLGICIASLVSETVYRQMGNYLAGLQTSFGMLVTFAWVTPVIAAVALRGMGLAKDVGHARMAH
ncbi:hypothetical protein Q5752_004614 [Cryptotrichosporon argae]